MEGATGGDAEEGIGRNTRDINKIETSHSKREEAYSFSKDRHVFWPKKYLYFIREILLRFVAIGLNLNLLRFELIL